MQDRTLLRELEWLHFVSDVTSAPVSTVFPNHTHTQKKERNRVTQILILQEKGEKIGSILHSDRRASHSVQLVFSVNKNCSNLTCIFLSLRAKLKKNFALGHPVMQISCMILTMKHDCQSKWKTLYTEGQIEPNQTKYEQILIKIGQCELPSIAKSKAKP